MRLVLSKSFFDFFYTSISKYLNVFINILGSAILARILIPEDFGKVAILLIIQSFFFLFGEMGIGIAIVQNNNLDRKNFKEIFTFTLIVAFSFSVLFSLVSYFVFEHSSDFYLALILSINIFFFILNIVPASLNRKLKKFKKISFYEFLSFFFGWLLCLLLAYYDFSFYSIALRYVFITIIYSFFCVYSVRDLLGFSISLDGIKMIWGFSLFQLLFNAVNFLSRNLDQVLIKFFYSNYLLGIYNRSYQLMVMPVGNITGTLSAVLLSHSSHLADDKEKFFIRYFEIMKVLILVSLLISSFLFVYSDNIILIILGEKWVEAIPIFRVMSLLAAVQIILSYSGVGYQVLGKSKEMFKSGSFLTIAVLLFLLINSYFFNFKSIVYSLFLGYVIGGIKIYYNLFKKCFNKNPLILIKYLSMPLLSFIVLGVILISIGIFQYNFLMKTFIYIGLVSLVFILPNIKEIKGGINFILKR